jgi:hypothetical protein
MIYSFSIVGDKAYLLKADDRAQYNGWLYDLSLLV